MECYRQHVGSGIWSLWPRGLVHSPGSSGYMESGQTGSERGQARHHHRLCLLRHVSGVPPRKPSLACRWKLQWLAHTLHFWPCPVLPYMVRRWPLCTCFVCRMMMVRRWGLCTCFVCRMMLVRNDDCVHVCFVCRMMVMMRKWQLCVRALCVGWWWWEDDDMLCVDKVQVTWWLRWHVVCRWGVGVGPKPGGRLAAGYIGYWRWRPPRACHPCALDEGHVFKEKEIQCKRYNVRDMAQ